MNLIILVDEIDITDESITEDLESELKGRLIHAIKDIKDINNFLEKEKSDNTK